VQTHSIIAPLSVLPVLEIMTINYCYINHACHVTMLIKELHCKQFFSNKMSRIKSNAKCEINCLNDFSRFCDDWFPVPFVDTPGNVYPQQWFYGQCIRILMNRYNTYLQHSHCCSDKLFYCDVTRFHLIQLQSTATSITKGLLVFVTGSS